MVFAMGELHYLDPAGICPFAPAIGRRGSEWNFSLPGNAGFVSSGIIFVARGHVSSATD
jgi:hypothetical protein